MATVDDPQRTFIAVSPEIRAQLNLVAAEATVCNRGKNVTQRVVNDVVLRHALEQLGDEAGQFVLRSINVSSVSEVANGR